MQKIAIALETTSDDQDEALAYWLTCRNADGRKPLPDVNALLTEVVQTAIEDAVPRCMAARQTVIVEALAVAPPDAWVKVAEVLQVKLP